MRNLKLLASFLAAVMMTTVVSVAAPSVSSAASGRTVTVTSNNLSRSEVHASYYSEFISSGAPNAAFNGNADNCQAGSVSAAYLRDQVERINWFRLLAGVDTDVTLDTSRSAAAQAAALIAARNGLSHSPSSSATCYTRSGADFSGLANLHKDTGVDAINGYFWDYGSSNTPVGHRRWLLNPRLGSVAIGEIPEVSGYDGGHAVSVLSDWQSAATKNPEAVVWPPAGYVPSATVYPRFSISVADADFSNASVSVKRNGTTISAPVVYRSSGTWDPSGPTPTLVFALANNVMPSGNADTTYEITVSGVNAPSGRTTYQWTTTSINADATPPAASAPGTGSQANSGSSISASLVNATFLDLVGRNATQAEINAWVGAASSTADRSVLVSQLAYSDVWVRSVIDGIYLKALDRRADDGGAAFWMSQIRSGKPVREIAAMFYSSPEYVRSSGTTSDWVTRLYSEVLGRNVDAGGLAYWVAETQRTSHADVALRFYQSVESRQTRVAALYGDLLDRNPDNNGRDFWAEQLLHLDDISLATFLVSSDEYARTNS